MINFPDAPTLNQVFTTAGRSWSWDGTKWTVYGSLALPLTITVTTTQTLTTGFSGIVRVENGTAGTITITLPASPTADQRVLLKDTLGNAATRNTIVSGGAVTIEGATTALLQYDYSWIELIYVPTKWVQI